MLPGATGDFKCLTSFRGKIDKICYWASIFLAEGANSRPSLDETTTLAFGGMLVRKPIIKLQKFSYVIRQLMGHSY